MWALGEGLLMCLNLDIVAVEIELDAKVVYCWITEEYICKSHYVSLILDCWTLINQISQVKISHYFCETNKCGNALAIRALALYHDIVSFDSPLVCICMLLFYDSLSMYYERRIPLTLVGIDSFFLVNLLRFSPK